MGLFSRKKKPRSPTSDSPDTRLADTLHVNEQTGEAHVQVELFDGDQEFEVAGESKFQDELLTVAGGKTADGVDIPQHAVLLPETDNKYDPNAVKVLIGMLQVGYLPRHLAKLWQAGILRETAKANKLVAVKARITGGWDRGGGDEGHFGVRLYLDPADFE